MIRNRLFAALVAAVCLSSCTGGSASETVATPSARPTPTPTVTQMRGPELLLDGEPSGVRLLERAIQDVKRLGLWRRLTKHLHVIKINAYSGTHNVPRDGHLADAIPGVMEGSDQELGLSCDIVFYMAAIGKEMRLSRAGILVRNRPSTRIAYASILAHELAHCLRGPHGEKVARGWEYRVERLMTR